MKSELEIDSWLRGGGLVVTASERAARFRLAEYHRSRRAEGLSAWQTPNVQDWQSFVRSEWEKRCIDGRLVLNGLQERSLWAGIVAGREPSARLLDATRHRLANLAMEAHQLICAYAPRFLDERVRYGWQHDPAEFGAWLAEFDEICRRDGLIAASRLPLELAEVLAQAPEPRPPLLLAGFDRLLPAQRALFAAWGANGKSPEAEAGERASQVSFFEAGDPASELAACAIWCRQKLSANSSARLLVIAQDVAKRRGEFERAFLRFAHPEGLAANSGSLFEFSLGIPLAQTGLVRSADLLLHWLSGPIEEHALDWLFSTPYIAADREESRALTAFVRALRRKGWQRTQWALGEFLRQKPGKELPGAWVARIRQAQRRLFEAARTQSRLAWAELAAHLLHIAGWPGAGPLGSIEFQVLQRWQRTLDDSASLGFNGRLVGWNDFFSDLRLALKETLFAPESQGAPILISGPGESAGLTADAVWFLGADEDRWPPNGATHPLLPLAVQREAAMPHASVKVDWDLAAAMTRRLLASAPKVRFSYSRQAEGVDKRPSRLVAQLAGQPQPLPAELSLPQDAPPITAPFLYRSQVPFPAGEATGGSNILTSQSQCPFKAFATARLGAEKWDPAEAGLTPAERGLLLHEAMHRIWAGPPDGIRSHAELTARTDLVPFVEDHVRAVLLEKTPVRARESLPSRYLELEGRRLATLIVEWLRYERERVPFTVEQTEAKADPGIAGLRLGLRLDRVDRLNDGSLLVIDYKTGDIKPSVWDLPRPEDVQLPLYAQFGLDRQAGDVGGLVFAKLRAGECRFDGKVRRAKATLRGALHSSTNLVQHPLKLDEMNGWRDKIEELARDFLAGRGDVNPRKYPETCERCGLHALCRIHEIQGSMGDPESADGPESGDE